LDQSPEREHFAIIGAGFLQAGCPSCHPTNSVEHSDELKALTTAREKSPTLLLYAVPVATI